MAMVYFRGCFNVDLLCMGRGYSIDMKLALILLLFVFWLANNNRLNEYGKLFLPA